MKSLSLVRLTALASMGLVVGVARTLVTSRGATAPPAPTISSITIGGQWAQRVRS